MLKDEKLTKEVLVLDLDDTDDSGGSLENVEDSTHHLLDRVREYGTPSLSLKCSNVTRKACSLASNLHRLPFVTEVCFNRTPFPASLFYRIFKAAPTCHIQEIGFNAFADDSSAAEIADILSTVSCLKKVHLCVDGHGLARLSQEFVNRNEVVAIINSLKNCALEAFVIEDFLVPWNALGDLAAIVEDHRDTLQGFHITRDQDVNREFYNLPALIDGQRLVESLLNSRSLIRSLSIPFLRGRADLTTRLMFYCADNKSPLRSLRMEKVEMKQIDYDQYHLYLDDFCDSRDEEDFERIVLNGVSKLRNVAKMGIGLNFETLNLHQVLRGLFESPSCCLEELRIHSGLTSETFPNFHAALQKYTKLRKIECYFDSHSLEPSHMKNFCENSTLKKVSLNAWHGPPDTSVRYLTELLRYQQDIKCAQIYWNEANAFDYDETTSSLREFGRVLEGPCPLEEFHVCGFKISNRGMNDLLSCLKKKPSLRILDLSKMCGPFAIEAVAECIPKIANLEEILLPPRTAPDFGKLVNALKKNTSITRLVRPSLPFDDEFDDELDEDEEDIDITRDCPEVAHLLVRNKLIQRANDVAAQENIVLLPRVMSLLGSNDQEGSPLFQLLSSDGGKEIVASVAAGTRWYKRKLQ